MNNTQFKRAISEALTREYELSVPAHNNDYKFYSNNSDYLQKARKYGHFTGYKN